MMKMHDLQPIKNVAARAVLVKDTAVFCSEGHIEREWEMATAEGGTAFPALRIDTGARARRESSRPSRRLRWLGRRGV